MEEFDSMIQPKYELNLIQFLIETHKASDQTSSGLKYVKDLITRVSESVIKTN